jgi:Holliday junction resolvase RusA-like endonuclease
MSGSITLPWAVVLHDNHRFVPARGRLIASPEYRTAKRAAETLLKAIWRGAPLVGAVVLHARCYFPDNRRRDAGNYRKLITDALTGIAYGDDAQLVRETWERSGVSRHNARIEITLTVEAT